MVKRIVIIIYNCNSKSNYNDNANNIKCNNKNYLFVFQGNMFVPKRTHDVLNSTVLQHSTAVPEHSRTRFSFHEYPKSRSTKNLTVECNRAGTAI